MGSILEIKPKIKVGTGDLELYFKMETMSGEVIVDKKADSLVPNFARLLMSAMGRNPIEGNLYLNFTESLNANGILHNTGDSYNNVTAVTPGNPTTVTVSNMSRLDGAGNYGIELYGIGGITPDINGFHEPADVGYNSDTEFTIAVDTTGSPAFVDEGARARMWENTTRTVPTIDYQEFMRFPMIFVGRDNTANVTDQQTLNEMFDAAEESDASVEAFELHYSPTTESVPAYNASTGDIELSLFTIVTNNSGASQTLEEAGLFTSFYEDNGDYYYTMIARDLIPSGYTLAQGESVTVTYKIKTTTGGGGGFTRAFMQILYRHLSGSSINITDITNTAQSSDENDAFFHLVSAAGEGTFQGQGGTGIAYDDIGVQLGTGNTAMTIDDYGLETRIDHGEGSGELVYYGTMVDSFDITGSVASFKIIAFFENLSGGAIGVEEFGLYVVSDYSGGVELDKPACIYREVLSSTNTVNDGDIIKVEIDFELTVA